MRRDYAAHDYKCRLCDRTMKKTSKFSHERTMGHQHAAFIEETKAKGFIAFGSAISNAPADTVMLFNGRQLRRNRHRNFVYAYRAWVILCHYIGHTFQPRPTQEDLRLATLEKLLLLEGEGSNTWSITNAYASFCANPVIDPEPAVVD